MKASKTSSSFTEEASKQKYNFYNKNVKNTPFTLIKENNKYIILMGQHLVSKKRFEKEEDAIDYIDSKPYELILIATTIYINELNNLKNTEKNGKY